MTNAMLREKPTAGSPYFDNCRNINFLGEDRDETVIRLADNAPTFHASLPKIG